MSKINKLNSIDKYAFKGLGIVEAKDGVELFESKDKSVVVRRNGDDAVMYFPLSDSINCYYEFIEPSMPKKVEYLLMDLDGTSIKSEEFWIGIIEEVTQVMIDNANFKFAAEDEPFISGYTVSEHLSYSLKKYADEFDEELLQGAIAKYFEIVRSKLAQIEAGTYHGEPFQTTDGLKELIVFCKEKGIKVCLVSSGLIEKARPEILSACEEMNIADPFDYYERIITGGVALEKDAYGTLGNYSAKPHPWLYFESMRSVGGNPSNTLAVEDSSAGVLSALSAGIPCISVAGGNISASGVNVLCEKEVANLCELKEILEKM